MPHHPETCAMSSGCLDHLWTYCGLHFCAATNTPDNLTHWTQVSGELSPVDSPAVSQLVNSAQT